MEQPLTIENESELSKVVSIIFENLEKNSKKVVALYGNLGTGKTTLTKKIAEKLSVTENITSPTFTIVNEYRSGETPLFHFDLYRIENKEELDLAFDINEYFKKDGISIIEWPEIIEDILPEETVKIRIEYVKEDLSGRQRKIEMLK
jgi:tRNA threonylcarbamoyladenosine biosynthesis protein TsaE